MANYLCNIDNAGSDCKTPLTGGGLKDADSYLIARKAALAVAKMDTGRCKDTVVENDDGDHYSGSKGIYYVDDYYYYNGFGSVGEKAFGTPLSVSRRHTTHKVIHRVPTYVYAAMVAVLASIATVIVLFFRWRRNKSRNMLNGGVVRFTQLPTDDDDSVFGNTAIGMDDPNPFSGAAALRGNDRYGSL